MVHGLHVIVGYRAMAKSIAFNSFCVVDRSWYFSNMLVNTP